MKKRATSTIQVLVVHNNQSAGTNDGANFLYANQNPVVTSRCCFRQTSAGRSANLHCLKLCAVLQAAADIKNDLP